MEKKLIALGKKIHNALLNCKDGDWTSPNLECACAVGSYCFMLAARKYLKIKMAFKASDGHCWLEYNNKIYDVTATQFGIKEKVFVLPKDKVPNLKNSLLRNQYKDANADMVKDINHLGPFGWPKEQKPITYKLLIDNDEAIIIRRDKHERRHLRGRVE